MPNTIIEVRHPRPREQERALMDAVHNALVTAFKIPNEDRTVRLIVHEPHRFEGSPRLSKPDLFTLISIDCFSGRSIDAKRALYKAIVENLAALDIPGDHVKIVLRESAPENWGVAGGRAACDIKMNFKIDV
jgi:phenylpyruvate tautomerase PptA (4-oxalocrotonate tautomerase family)